MDQHDRERPQGLRTDHTRPRHLLQRRTATSIALWKLINDVELQHMLPPGFPEYAGAGKEGHLVPHLLLAPHQRPIPNRRLCRSADGANLGERMSQNWSRSEWSDRRPSPGVNPPLVWLTLDEAHLRRTVGTPPIMREQLEFLLRATERPEHHASRSCPTALGYHAGLEGSFTILGFADEPVCLHRVRGVRDLIEKPARFRTRLYAGTYSEATHSPSEESQGPD